MFRNIVLPYDEEVNSLEQNSTRKVADAGYFKNIEVGAGSKTMKMDERGFWMGAEDFEDAPFRIDMEGNARLRASSLTEEMSFIWEDASGNESIFIGFTDA
jgi:hypothetical protein